MIWFKLAILVVTGIYIIYKDLKERIIPDKINGALFLIGVVFMVMEGNYLSAILGSLLLGSALFLLVIITKGFGMGDVKYLYASGMLLGLKWAGYGLTIGIILGGLGGLYMITVKKMDRKSFMAYGPYLVIGNWLALFLVM
ncbi:MAG: prepilin peptidase [Clostridia bacterium]|nr:prepilin peptidase [Clostridia bacterium]